ncbi:MAG: hypothetical protein J0I99_19710 [Devosia sp.]|uniref:hypothetical protein n=1 Tax=Devosia sp. TaxID=1871048 RepID=UPI001AD04A43|nr:hypothetical protein [Devosia sp.]MBN9317973.1 hypothetical protein [Devosia sp.]
MMFELKRHELAVLFGQLKTLKGVPLRAQRKDIIAMAEVALPKGAANQVFLAIGSGGEMSQAGAAQSVLDQALPDATYVISSANTKLGKAYTAAVEVVVQDSRYHFVAQDMASAGLALLTAAVGCLGDIARDEVVDLPAIPLRAGGPIIP